MKRFLYKLMLFIAFFILIIVACGAIPDNSPVQDLNYSIFDKQKLLKEVDEPRLILVGGSNVSFGFDSKKIQESLGLNVINTGIHAGYGMEYMINFITPYLKEGDIVVIAAEYNQFFGDGVWGGEGLMGALDVQPGNICNLSFKQIQNMVPYIPRYAMRKIKNYLTFYVNPGTISTSIVGVNDRRSYNKYGDIYVHWNRPNEKFDNQNVEKVLNPYSIKLVSRFKKEIESKHGRLYLTYPAYNRSAYDVAKDDILKLEKEFLKNQFAVLGTPEKYSFPDSFYFNSSYHLNRKGIDMRTEMLCQDLKNYEHKNK